VTGASINEGLKLAPQAPQRNHLASPNGRRAAIHQATDKGAKGLLPPKATKEIHLGYPISLSFIKERKVQEEVHDNDKKVTTDNKASFQKTAKKKKNVTKRRRTPPDATHPTRDNTASTRLPTRVSGNLGIQR
jgi:hypothetical protein